MKYWKAILLFALMHAASAALAGELGVSKTTIDYGSIKEGPPVVNKLILNNTGDSVLEISNVKAS